jgi:hypothetical protein
MLALSLDMGGTHIGRGVVRDNELLGSASLDSELAGSLESLLPCIVEVLRTLLKDSGVTAEECAGIAIGVRGNPGWKRCVARGSSTPIGSPPGHVSGPRKPQCVCSHFVVPLRSNPVRVHRNTRTYTVYDLSTDRSK